MAGICTKVKCHAQKCMRAKKEPLSWHWLRGCRKTQGKAGKSRSPFALCASLLSILPSRLAPCHLPIPPSRLTPRHRSTVQHGRLASCAKRTCDVPCFTGLTTACFRHWRRPSSLFPSGKRRLRVLTKSQKNEALIRNDGVYVISGIFSGANACVCGKKMHSRPDRWPQIARFASGRADSLANRRFVND